MPPLDLVAFPLVSDSGFLLRWLTVTGVLAWGMFLVGVWGGGRRGD